MGRRKRKRKKRFDSPIKSQKKLIRSLTYSYSITEIDGRIHLTVANHKGDHFVIVYRDYDRCLDSRDNKVYDYKTVESELKRMLGDSGILAHKEASFRLGVIS